MLTDAVLVFRCLAYLRSSRVMSMGHHHPRALLVRQWHCWSRKRISSIVLRTLSHLPILHWCTVSQSGHQIWVSHSLQQRDRGILQSATLRILVEWAVFNGYFAENTLPAPGFELVTFQQLRLVSPSRQIPSSWRSLEVVCYLARLNST